MARQTFFSFRYKADNWRAANIRSSWVTKTGKHQASSTPQRGKRSKKRKVQILRNGLIMK